MNKLTITSDYFRSLDLGVLGVEFPLLIDFWIMVSGFIKITNFEISGSNLCITFDLEVSGFIRTFDLSIIDFDGFINLIPSGSDTNKS